MQNGLNATVAEILAELPLPDPPVNYYSEDDNVSIGQTWIDSPYPDNRQVARGARNRSLAGWSMGRLLNEGINIREKMVLFWHNHFAIERQKVNDPKFIYRYITLLRENALGNFKQLVKDVTIDPAMLRYLDGHQNTRRKPNENYARELLELFFTG